MWARLSICPDAHEVYSASPTAIYRRLFNKTWNIEDND
jgi:hypothetical protein